MFPDRHPGLELAAQTLRRRARADFPTRRRAPDLTPPEWPRGRGPTPNPRRH
jgi:hypothetical protein